MATMSLASALADGLAVAFDQLEADRQGVVVLPGRGQGLGELELELGVVGVLGERRAGGLDAAAGLPPLEPEGDLGLEPLGLGLEEPVPAFHVEDAGLGVLEAAVLQRDPRQADLCRYEVGVERQGHVVLGLGGPGVRRLEPTRLGDDLLGRGRHQPVEPRPGSPPPAGRRRNRPPPGRPARRRRPGSTSRRTPPPARARARCPPWPARTARRIPPQAPPAPARACGTGRTTLPRSRSRPGPPTIARSPRAGSSPLSPR